jgi:CRP-like cAMP-binding protein
VSVQAVTDSTLLIMNSNTVRALGQTDARFAWAVAEEVAHRLNDVLEVFAGTAFGSIRQRLARHLLDLDAWSSIGILGSRELTASLPAQQRKRTKLLGQLTGCARNRTSQPQLAQLMSNPSTSALLRTTAPPHPANTRLRPPWWT